MPNRYSRISKARKRTIIKPLQRIFERVLQEMDHSILEGYRGLRKQNKYFDEGKSKLRYPKSNHNKIPSLAGDIAPWPINWNDYGRFYQLAALMFRAAAVEKIKIRWGGDWDRDGDMWDQSFHDLPHFEYKGKANKAECEYMLKIADIYEAAAKRWQRRYEKKMLARKQKMIARNKKKYG